MPHLRSLVGRYPVVDPYPPVKPLLRSLRHSCRTAGHLERDWSFFVYVSQVVDLEANNSEGSWEY
jgi:hypothetical protein